MDSIRAPDLQNDETRKKKHSSVKLLYDIIFHIKLS